MCFYATCEVAVPVKHRNKMGGPQDYPTPDCTEKGVTQWNCGIEKWKAGGSE